MGLLGSLDGAWRCVSPRNSSLAPPLVSSRVSLLAYRRVVLAVPSIDAMLGAAAPQAVRRQSCARCQGAWLVFPCRIRHDA